MPIVRKLEDLERFCQKLLDVMHGKREIGFYTLEYEIAGEFGVSDYIQDSIKKALLKFNLIRPIDVSRFEILYKLDIKGKEKKIEKDLDKYEQSK